MWTTKAHEAGLKDNKRRQKDDNVQQVFNKILSNIRNQNSQKFSKQIST